MSLKTYDEVREAVNLYFNLDAGEYSNDGYGEAQRDREEKLTAAALLAWSQAEETDRSDWMLWNTVRRYFDPSFTNGVYSVLESGIWLRAYVAGWYGAIRATVPDA